MEKILTEIIKKLPADENGFVFIGEIWHEVRAWMEIELEFMRQRGKLEQDEESNVIKYKLK